MYNLSVLQALHWVPVKARMGYKLSAICHSFSDSSPILEQKTLDNAVSSPVLQSNGMRSLPTSVTFQEATPSKLQLSLQTIPQQAIQIPSSQCRHPFTVPRTSRSGPQAAHVRDTQTRRTLKHTGHSNTQTCFPSILIPWAWKQPFLHGDEPPLCRQSPNSATLSVSSWFSSVL